MEQILKYLILGIGWPVLILMSVLIVKRGYSFYSSLKGTVIGKLIIPTVFGWLFGMYSLGIVSTAYMICLPWYYTVIFAFLTFLIAINIVYKAMKGWEKEATELQAFYENLEVLVKKRTAELEKAHSLAIKHEKEIQKLKDQFVFIAAHELKTPVTAIKWALEITLEEGKDHINPELYSHLQQIQSSNERLITLVDDLLNVARIEAGTIKIVPADFDLDIIIKSTIEEMQSVFKTKNIAINYDPPGKVTVLADQQRIKQVLINLLSNATKYNKEKGKITVKLETLKNHAKVSITDTGIGIKKVDLKKLFQKFGRVESDETRDIEGTGLGLYLCKEIITKSKGEIKVESIFGKGSTFSFTVPLA
ncbi:HAMP domain-containing histidine kinase [Candidatus Dojkabacteria bacterium]|nr:HAMP domain-containing histidine kinase [Candidatus Dojkabacteria bacterium]